MSPTDAISQTAEIPRFRSARRAWRATVKALNAGWRVRRELPEGRWPSLGYPALSLARVAGPRRARDAVAATIAHFGRVDILVNNAGIRYIESIETFDESRGRTMLDVMLIAPFLLIQAVWLYMPACGWGRIVTIASIHARVASSGKNAYESAKHGLIGLTRNTVLEDGAHGITVNALCPAYVRSARVERQIADQARWHECDENTVVEQIMLSQAAIKCLITPEEIAATVAYLASDAANALTGADWSMDLGWTAQ